MTIGKNSKYHIYIYIYICVYIFKLLWNQYFLISVDFQLVSGNDFLKYWQKRKSRMLFFKFTLKTGTRPRWIYEVAHQLCEWAVDRG